MTEDLSALREISRDLARRDREAMAALIERRRAVGLTQSAIDGAFGLPEGSTGELEAYDSDPRLSELRRYEALILFKELISRSDPARGKIERDPRGEQTMAIEREQDPAEATIEIEGVAIGSVADIYASSPLAPLLLKALDHRPGDHTSEDFRRGYFAALAVAHIRGAAALEEFGGSEWEYGWRSFFPNGEEYEWLATQSRAEAEQQIRDYQEEEDTRFADKEDSEGKLTYSLWRRRKAAAGPWERVEEPTDEQR